MSLVEEQPFATLMSEHSLRQAPSDLLIEHEGHDEDTPGTTERAHTLGLSQRQRPGKLTRAFCRSSLKAEQLAVLVGPSSNRLPWKKLARVLNHLR